MPDSTSTLYSLTVYTPEFRWSGELAVPTHRRLSDFVNDPGHAVLVLQNVTPAIWEKGALVQLDKRVSVAVMKDSIVLATCSMDSAAQRQSSYDIVRKEPHAVLIYAPPLVLSGNIHVSSGASWLVLLDELHQDFMPVTRLSTGYLATRKPVESGPRLGLVNRRWMVAIESMSKSWPHGMK